jgi:hypothetical protein
MVLASVVKYTQARLKYNFVQTVKAHKDIKAEDSELSSHLRLSTTELSQKKADPQEQIGQFCLRHF